MGVGVSRERLTLAAGSPLAAQVGTVRSWRWAAIAADGSAWHGGRGGMGVRHWLSPGRSGRDTAGAGRRWVSFGQLVRRRASSRQALWPAQISAAQQSENPLKGVSEISIAGALQRQTWRENAHRRRAGDHLAEVMEVCSIARRCELWRGFGVCRGLREREVKGREATACRRGGASRDAVLNRAGAVAYPGSGAVWLCNAQIRGRPVQLRPLRRRRRLQRVIPGRGGGCSRRGANGACSRATA